MSSSPVFSGRRLRVCYWSAEARVVDADSMALEQHLKRLGDVTLTHLKALEGPEAAHCDLLIIAAQKVAAIDFSRWLGGLRGRIQALGTIWTPVVILADIPFEGLSEILPTAVQDNWYFDILAPAHLASLPIRVANLVRIHDHLQELKRYSAALEDVSTKVATLEAQVRQMRTGNQKP